MSEGSEARAVRELPVPLLDWWALELAFGHVAPGHHAFLDRTTAEVVNVHEGQPGARERLVEIAADGARYIRIEPVPSRDQHRWMVRYIATVDDPDLRARLGAAVAQAGAFRVFKDVLGTVPEARDRWFAFRKLQLRETIERWISEHDVAAEAPAEAVQPAPELREQGHRLLGELPTSELPNAIAYLMHLAARHR